MNLRPFALAAGCLLSATALATGANVSASGQDPEPASASSTVVAVDDQVPPIDGQRSDVQSDVTRAVDVPVTGTTKTLVLTVGLRASHGTSKTAPDLTPSQVSSAVDEGTQDWFEQVSYGRFGGFSTGGAHGGVTVQTTKAPCSVDWYREIADQADAFARAHRGVDPSSFDAVVYYIGPGIGCEEHGRAEVDGRRVWLVGTTFFGTVVHEFGHNLGLQHASSQLCGGGTVPLSDDCVQNEYGDTSSAMGGTAPGGYSAPALAQLGWSQGRVTTVSGNNATATYILSPLELNGAQPVGLVPPLQSIRLVDGKTLWLEYRRPTGVDRFGAFGLQVRVEQPGVVGSPFLLKMTPQGGTSFLHPEMTVGQTWANPYGVSTITLDAADPDFAKVTITTPLPVPDVRGDTLDAAADALAAVGFVSGLIEPRFDPDCESLALVITQTPAPGTRLLPGDRVDLTYGVEPRNGCPIPH